MCYQYLLILCNCLWNWLAIYEWKGSKKFPVYGSMPFHTYSTLSEAQKS